MASGHTWYPVVMPPAHEHNWTPYTRVARRWPLRPYVLFACSCGELLKAYESPGRRVPEGRF